MMSDQRDKQPGRDQGNLMGTGIAIGVAIGAALGIVMDNLAIGIAIGVAIGVAIGSAMQHERKNRISSPEATGKVDDRSASQVVLTELFPHPQIRFRQIVEECHDKRCFVLLIVQAHLPMGAVIPRYFLMATSSWVNKSRKIGL